MREISFTKNNGEIVSRAYVRSRVSSGLSRWRDEFSVEVRREIIRQTVDNDEWIGFRNGMVAAAIVRDAEDVLLTDGWELR
jgi:hypothetical protein